MTHTSYHASLTGCTLQGSIEMHGQSTEASPFSVLGMEDLRQQLAELN